MVLLLAYAAVDTATTSRHGNQLDRRVASIAKRTTSSRSGAKQCRCCCCGSGLLGPLLVVLLFSSVAVVVFALPLTAGD
jgi:hypothetical protein